MRVLLGPYFPSDSGVGEYTLGLAEALISVDCQVTLAGYNVPRSIRNRCPVIELPDDPSWAHWLGGPLIEQSIKRHWMRRIDWSDADVVHFTTPPPASTSELNRPVTVCSVFNYQSLANILYDIPRTEFIHRRPLAISGWLQFYLMDRFGERACNCLVLTTSAAGERVLRDLGENSSRKLISYVPPCSRWIPKREADREDGRRLQLVFAERDLSRPRNNLRALLLALGKMNGETLNRLSLTLLGRGLVSPDLRLLTKLGRNGLEVDVQGWVSHDTYRRVLQEADVYVSLRDIWEQASLGAIEAMSSGLCVIARKGASYEDIVDDGSGGYLIDPHQPEELTEILWQLLSNPALVERLQNGARTKWERFFCPPKVGAALLSLYRKAVSR